jgi:catechol 2,3-dioxygenase-like lactoylglutathione lyase family enzyme
METHWKTVVRSSLFLGAITVMGFAQQSRPTIIGISHMSVYTADPVASEHFYTFTLGAAKGADPQDAHGIRYYLSPTQFVEVLPLPEQHGLSRMDRVAFSTTNAAGLRLYLKSHGIDSATELRSGSDGSHWFEAKDPEGNRVEFFQAGRLDKVATESMPIGSRIIHVGMFVRNRATQDHFYRELLGFRPYWYGGRQPGFVDWASEQVPEGHDWIEYMLAGEGTTLTLDKVDQARLGVMNHFSIGVPNIEAAVTTMIVEDRMGSRHDGPQMGRDGKWQANFYDPDGTRVELMEFQPTVKPCCSPFTAESPTH